MGEILLVVDSAMEHVALVGLAVRGICSEAVPDESEAYLLELAVVEAVTNVIRHAYDLRPGYRVEVTVETAPGRLEVRVRDHGRAMDPALLQGPPLRPPDGLDDLPEGGMGLPIIREAMDEVSYESRGGINELAMVRRLPLLGNG